MLFLIYLEAAARAYILTETGTVTLLPVQVDVEEGANGAPHVNVASSPIDDTAETQPKAAR